MDMLLLWVTIGFLVEATRMAVQKCCKETNKKQNEGSSLREPLLKPEEVLDDSGRCRMGCCSHILENANSQDFLDLDEYFPETSEGGSDSLGSLRAITDDSEEDLEEQGVKIIKWEDLLENVSVKLVGDRKSSLKGKEIVEELEEDTTDSDTWSRSEIIPSRIRRGSRGKNSAKIYPEPLDPPLTSQQGPNSHAGQISSEYGLKIYAQSSRDYHCKADAEFPTFTGECSKS